MLAQHELVAADADRFGPHDFIRQLILEDAVLMDASFVREGVVADDRFVCRHRESGDLREQAAGRIYLFGDQVGAQTEEVGARADRHRDFFHRRVAGTFADAVDRAFDLARAVAHGGKGVGYRHAEIVVTVHAPAHAVTAGSIGDQIAEERTEFFGDGVARGVRHVERDGSAFDHLAQHLDQKIAIRARGIFGRKFDIVEVLLRKLHRPAGCVDDFLPAHHELALEVQVGGRNENVNARAFGLLHALDRLLEIRLARACQAEHGRFGYGLGNTRPRVEVSRRRHGEAGLDDIDVQLLELTRDHYFFFDIHRRARRLLTVAQRGVEDPYGVLVCRHPRLLTGWPPCGTRNKKGHGGSCPWPFSKNTNATDREPARGVLRLRTVPTLPQTHRAGPEAAGLAAAMNPMR